MSQAISVHLQGTNFTLLVIHAYTTCITDIRLALMEKMKNTPHFFSKNTPVVINISNINKYDDWINIYKAISGVGLFIVGVCCCHNKKLKNIITNNGVPILTEGNITKEYQKKNNSKTSLFNYTNSLYFTKTQIINTPIRSGQKIYAKNRDLIIISNVNSGAEVIADGNVHIYGIMKGRVLAGASGYKDSQIFCTNLLPELISIGGHYWLNDQIPQKFLGKAARICFKNNTLVIQYIL